MTPSSSTMGFLGWSKKAITAGTGDISDAISPSVQTFTEDTNLYPVIGSGYWLRFDKNDNDTGVTKATYTNPKFITTTKVQDSDRPENPIRQGYVFGGWYKDKNLTEKFNFDGSEGLEPVQKDITVYAKWSPGKDTNYTVIIWKQKASDDVDAESKGNEKYDFEVAITLQGTTGASISAPSKYTSIENGDSLILDNTTYDFTGFHYDTAKHSHQDTETSKTIAADGSTVFNVYYNRNTITYYFYSNPRNSYNKSGKFLDGSGKYVDNLTYRGLYEAPLNFTWPTTYYEYNSWNGMYKRHGCLFRYYSSNKDNDGTVLSFTGDYKLPNPTDTTISLYRTSSGNIPINFYKQNADGSWNKDLTVNMGGGTFTITDKYTGFYAYQYEYESVGSTTHYEYKEATNGQYYYWSGGYYSVYDPYWGFNFSYYENPGYYRVGEYPAPNAKGTHNLVEVTDSGSTGKITLGQANDEGKYGSVQSGTYKSLSIYFARKHYTLTFIDSIDRRQLGSDNLVYEGNLSVFANGGTKDASSYVNDITHDGYVFSGWYSDPECATPYDFNETMPAHNIVVYAGWKQLTHNVIVEPNGGIYKGENTITIKHGQTIESSGKDVDALQNINRDSYSFIGWYKVKEDETEEIFDLDTAITEDTTIKAHWKKIGSFGVRYINTDPTTDPPIDGEQLKLDPSSYADQAEVTVLSAPDGNKIPSGYEFIGWSDGTNTYVPGATFTLNASDSSKLTTVGSKDYVTLRAQYTKIDTTYIIYNSNEGSGTLTNPYGISNNTQADIPLNASTTLSNGDGFTREGYKLIGWNSNQEDATKGIVEWKLGETVGVDGNSNMLYAVWKKSTNIIIKKTGTDGAALTGAEFNFTFTNSNGSSVSVSGNHTVTVDSVAGVEIDDLENGSYTLKETKAPVGYIISTSDTHFTISNDGVTIGTTPAKTEIRDGKKYYVISISNTAGAKLPSTGGTGTLPYTLGGLAIISMAALMYGYVARRNKQERG